MRRYVVLGVACANLATVNVLIALKEHVPESGRTMFLRLKTAERGSSPIQGDHIALRYSVPRKLAAEVKEKGSASGCLVVKLGRKDVAKLVRVHRGEELSEGEHLLRYRLRGHIRLGADSFFFEKGHAEHYKGARFGEFRVAPSGESVLVNLRDRRLRRLGPPGGKE